jgi:cold-inducible RNA-binding protein
LYWEVTPVTNIYVGNLSFQATEDEIRSAFSQYGEVAAVSIVKDRDSGRSRGFCFVEMPNSEEAKLAIDGIDQREIAGRTVNVNEARPRKPRAGGSPHGGRRM